MQDLFWDYEGYNKEYIDKKDLYDKLMLYNIDLLEGMYYNLLEMSPGIDLFCIDYMEFGEYTNMVSSQYVAICSKLFEELKTLKNEYECAFNLKEAILKRIKLFSCISLAQLLELLQLFNVDFESSHGIINTNNDDENFFDFAFDTFDLVDDEGSIAMIMQYLLGEEGCDFIRFYINYQSFIRNKCSIDEVYTIYKNSCLNR